MASINQRKYNRAALAAELAGLSTYRGPPCKRDVAHVETDGMTPRDTVRRTCNRCQVRKVEPWREEAESCTST